MSRTEVAVIRAARAEYPRTPPFHPPERYPEYPYEDTDSTNAVYAAVRDLLIKLGMDRENCGTGRWNPLGDIIKPGDSVVIKPNFVSEARSEHIDPKGVVTHGSVIRPIIDYCLIALKSRGSLAVADAPQTDSDFEKIKEATGIPEVISYINGVSPLKVDLLDLREEVAQISDGIILRMDKKNGDPKGYTIVNLGEKSAFQDIEPYMDRVYGAYYDVEKVRNHHNRNRHEYCISNTVLDADVVISVPKMKTHIKAGVTMCLKNIVGINGNKNYLPHYRFGSREEGGDEYLRKSFPKTLGSKFYQLVFNLMSRMGPRELKLMRLPRKLYSFLKSQKITRHSAGSWYGNDTIWRTIADLNRILFYADKEGRIRDGLQRKFLGIVDGIVAGEGEGPLIPTPKPCGVIFGGFDPVLVDLAGIGMMGFNYRHIPQVVMTGEMLGVDIARQPAVGLNLHFRPPAEWRAKLNSQNTER